MVIFGCNSTELRGYHPMITDEEIDAKAKEFELRQIDVQKD